MAKAYEIVCLPGDGIGPEIVASAKAVLTTVAEKFGFTLHFKDYAFGGAGIDFYGTPYADEVCEAVINAQAVFLGSVGGPKWDNAKVRPEAGLLAMRKSLDVFANVRPLKVSGALLKHSPIKSDIIDGADLVIVRELSSGAYFGTPRKFSEKEALDTIYYAREEIDRVLEYAFKLALKRRKHLTSVDKANVLASSRLWRERVIEMAKRYPEVELRHEYVDAMAMHLVTQPKHFDVIVTENLFGDVLSDEASVLGGSLGVLPSASFNQNGPFLYEPAHGSAPDIAGQNKANPIATILSAAMMLRFSFSEDSAANFIEEKVQDLIDNNQLTADLNKENPLSTTEVTDILINNIQKS